MSDLTPLELEIDMVTENDWVQCQMTKCRHCGSSKVKYRLVEDGAGHEDAEYKCDKCGKPWWLDGIDS